MKFEKLEENRYDQNFLVSLCTKLEKFDEKIFKFVAIKSSKFD